jgi:hypothetical protein
MMCAEGGRVRIPKSAPPDDRTFHPASILHQIPDFMHSPILVVPLIHILFGAP